MSTVLHLERPTFWTETNDAESWFRALEAVGVATTSQPQSGTPRTVAERCLVGVIPWRGAAGLFGNYQRNRVSLLPGVGLVTCGASGHWDLGDEAKELVRTWKTDVAAAIHRLAGYLVRESPWLRLLLLRLQHGDWELCNWATVRRGRAGLKVGTSLVLHSHVDPRDWFDGAKQQMAGRWLARTGCSEIAYAPGVMTRRKGKDDLSLSPLTAPLSLLEAVGWLSRSGELSLPLELLADLVGSATPSQTLATLTKARADIRGMVAVEPILRELLATYRVTPNDGVFGRWMDALIEQAQARGALEVLDSQPGQPRHGRGLNADSSRQLVRWAVHPEFDNAFHNAWDILETEKECVQ